MSTIKFIKLSSDAVVPKKANFNDVGFDLVAVSKKEDLVNNCWIYGTGLAIELPPCHAGLLFPRSSVYKTSLSLANCVGVIDSGFRQEILVIFRPIPDISSLASLREHKEYNVGDRIAQLVIIKYDEYEFIEVDKLDGPDRGGGFGSTNL